MIKFRFLKFFDKYYLTLGLPPNSEDPQIKSAYRRLAKMYHPDISGDENTRQKFIEVNEAYEILIRRQIYIQDAIRRYNEKQGTSPRQPTAGDFRDTAGRHADMRYEQFARSPLYRTAMVMDSAADYIFLIIGVFMIFSPIVVYFTDMDESIVRGEEPELHLFPLMVGIAFLYGVWYFIFKNKD